jgi:hypothetical protein
MQATTPIGSLTTSASCEASIGGITRPAKLRPISA